MSYFPNPTHMIELRGGKLYYENYRRGFDAEGRMFHAGSNRETITPTPSEWRQFRKDLDSLSVWNWQAEYDDPYTADGIGWKFKISYADHVLETRGSNNYPDEQGALGRDNEKFPPDISPTPTFKALLAAIGKLVRNRSIGR